MPRIEERKAIVKTKYWAPGDPYKVIEVQVFRFNDGDRVKVTIEDVET